MPPTKWKTGARPSPRHKLLAAEPFKPSGTVPGQFALVPKQLDAWGNDQYGNCVSAEEAFAKACDNPEDFIGADVVIAWARKHGFLNGADLPEVMDAMFNDGMVVGSNQYNDGKRLGVDYSNETVLQAALAQGPVKIAIDSSALPSGAGNNQGWSKFGGRPGQYGNTDHSVALCGYGDAKYLADKLGVSAPSGAPAGKLYLLYTWKTIGFIDHAWLMSTCTEAWLRLPTTVIVGPEPQPMPPNVDPTPTPTPTPTPAPSIWSIIWPLILQYGPQIIAFLISLLHHAQQSLEQAQKNRGSGPAAK